jgi:hypothetical protein
MIVLRANVRYVHNGVVLKPGDTFEVETELEANDLVAVGFASRIDSPSTEERPQEGPKSGRYDRRDLRGRS